MAAAQVQANTFLHSGGTYESVDLGLPSGTKWAKCNIGANTETEYGDLFAWGATKPYRLSGSTVYDSADNYSASYANTIQHDLYPNEDAATVNWGKGWVMPTKAQFDELVANTTGTWTAISGVNGFKFTAINGNYIFFPAAGLVNGGSLDGRGSGGNYWGRTHMSSMTAWRLYVGTVGKDVGAGGRGSGLSVRPVLAQ